MRVALSEVAVLLCTFNGGRYLAQQLESLRQQNGITPLIYVSDDVSTDNTLQIIEDFRARHPGQNVTIRRGPEKGCTSNFLSLATARNIDAYYFAYSDQDDIWDPDKLCRALAQLGALDPAKPALYCSRTRSVSETGMPIGTSPLFQRKPSFANALVQNMAGGNTMVFNKPARQLLIKAGPVDVVSHDWWTYLLISGAGGSVVYDSEPGISYRQHQGNMVGANTGVRRRLSRYKGFWSGRNRDWNQQNLDALDGCAHLLTPENRELLAQFKSIRGGTPVARLKRLISGGFYAQTLSGNLGLFIASLLKKI